MKNDFEDCFTKIRIDNYDIIKIIGTGAFGRVYLIKNKITHKSYALKALKKSKIIESNQIEHSYSERTILKELNHQFLISLYHFCQDSKYLYFILDFIPGGELFTLIRSEASFKPDNARFYVAQIIQALNYLHSKKIIYRDLKPENILFDFQGYIKITDLGAAKILDGKTYTLLGTPTYLAPEVILKHGYHFAADWWSLGVLTYEMVVGIDPWDENDPHMIYQKIIEGKVLFPKNMHK